VGFRGFPPEALVFLRDLEANNDREWFKANKARHAEHVVAPMQALAGDLAHLGPPHLFRPYNDTRFHNRPPIKEQQGMVLGHGLGAAWYVELSLDGLFVAAGMWRPAPDQVERFRQAVDDGRRAGALRRALSAAGKAGLALGEPDLKRVPRGWPPDHPCGELLRHKSVVVSERHELGEWLHTPACGERIRTQFDAAAPLVRWLREQVGPSQRPAR